MLVQSYILNGVSEGEIQKAIEQAARKRGREVINLGAEPAGWIRNLHKDILEILDC